MENYTFYENLFKAFPTPTLVILPDLPRYTIVDVNKAFLTLFSLSEKTVLGSSFSSVVEQGVGLKDLNWEKLFVEVLKGKSSLKHLIDCSSKDGPVIDIEASSFEIVLTPCIKGENIENIIVCVNSLHSRPLADPDQVIQFEQIPFKKTLPEETERIADGASWEVFMDTSSVYWSKKVRIIHEVDSSYQPTLESALNFYEESESREMIEKAIAEIIIQGTSFELELLLTTAKGNSRWVRATGKAELKEGKCVRIHGLLQDISEIKKLKSDLIKSQNQLESLLQFVEGIPWEADLQAENPTFVSDKLYSFTGFDPEGWRDHLSFLLDHLHPDDKEIATRFYQSLYPGSANSAVEYRLIKANGSILWIYDLVAIIYEKGKPRWLRGIMMNVTLKKRNAQLEKLEKQVYELNAQEDVPLQEIIKLYLLGIENLFPHIICSFYQVRGNYLYDWASPSLPQILIDEVGPVPIASDSMSCGTAAFRKEPVIVRDIATDPLWENYRDLVLPYALKSCWSFPVLDSKGKVLASLGVYFREVKNPEEDVVKVVEKSMPLFKLILENRKSQKLLQDASILMKQGQNFANLGNWRWNIHTNEVQWSDSLYTIYGLDKNSFEVTWDNYLALIHPDDRAMVKRKLTHAIATKQEAEFEEKVIHADGGIRNLKSWCKVILNEDKEAMEMVGASLDISESKSIQRRLTKSQILLTSLVKELRISNERYKFANKATNEAIYDLDRENQTLHWGEGFQRLFGYKDTLYPFGNDSGISLIHPSETTKITKDFNEFLNDPSRSQWNPQYRFLKADQSYAYVEENGYAIRDKDGKVIRIIGALRDISLRNSDERKMRQLHHELERNLRIMAISNAELEQFAYTISHDLLEPLRMITGFLAQLEKKYAELLDEKGKRYIFYAVDGAKRMRQIILDMLNFSKVGRLDEEKEHVDLNILMREILILYRRKIRDKQASFRIAGLPTVYTLKSSVQLVFQNLISNALAFQREGIPPVIEISFEETESIWQFTVADNGIGIDEALLDRVFILFHRLPSDKNMPGTGMGLAVSKKIVESLGGKIWVESKKSTGSEFHFTLPHGTVD